ncbi:hypothetical protein EJB05_56237, partial [Eragrostis curvula]
MAGNRRGRGRRRARSPPDESSASQERATPREVAVAERPSKRTGHIWRCRALGRSIGLPSSPNNSSPQLSP